MVHRSSKAGGAKLSMMILLMSSWFNPLYWTMGWTQRRHVAYSTSPDLSVFPPENTLSLLGLNDGAVAVWSAPIPSSSSSLKANRFIAFSNVRRRNFLTSLLTLLQKYFNAASGMFTLISHWFSSSPDMMLHSSLQLLGRKYYITQKQFILTSLSECTVSVQIITINMENLQKHVRTGLKMDIKFCELQPIRKTSKFHYVLTPDD